jgi:hypothetical protein
MDNNLMQEKNILSQSVMTRAIVSLYLLYGQF